MNQKLISEFINLGCPTKKEAAVTLQVYLELCEVKKYFDVEYHFNQGLNCMSLTGKKRKSSEVMTFVPIPVSDGISFMQMEKYLTLSNLDPKSVILAMVDADSTCVYYQITEGIKDPQPETSHVSIEEKRTRLDLELRKHKKLLEEAALYSIPITLNKDVKKKNEGEDKE